MMMISLSSSLIITTQWALHYTAAPERVGEGDLNQVWWEKVANMKLNDPVTACMCEWPPPPSSHPHFLEKK